MSTRILTDCIAAFRNRYPRVRYEIFSGNAENIRDSIERGLLDMGLMAEPIDIRKYGAGIFFRRLRLYRVRQEIHRRHIL